MDIKARARKLKTDIPAVLLAMKKKETPFVAKILAGITVAYALSPTDCDRFLVCLIHFQMLNDPGIVTH